MERDYCIPGELKASQVSIQTSTNKLESNCKGVALKFCEYIYLLLNIYTYLFNVYILIHNSWSLVSN